MSDLSMTAMYTSATWAWGKLPNADLLVTPEAERVFRLVNGALDLTRPFTHAPSLPHSLLERHGILDQLILESGCKQIVELAAGLSRRGISMTEDPSVRYVEVDLPHVVAAKRNILERSERGGAALARENFELVAHDITTIDLNQMFHGTCDPIFVVAEGLLMYLDETAQKKLFGAISERLASVGGSFAFDLVPRCEQPPPGAVGRALGGLMKRFTRGGDFVRDERTRHDIRGDLLACGFSAVELREPRASKHSIQQLVFSSERIAHKRSS
jgi:O-methyltransferase involved in polyketide biosynthesis